MPQKTRQRLAFSTACCLVLLACRSDGDELAGETEMTDDTTLESETSALLALDLDTRHVVQPVGSELAEAAEQKFIQLEITEVHNPKQIRLTFEVHYRPEHGEESLLGTFALFPPDNPGNFIVATRGELRSEGTVVLSMQVLDEVESEDEIRVTLKPISFRKE